MTPASTISESIRTL